MTGFEPRTPGVGSDRSTNRATTTGLHKSRFTDAEFFFENKGQIVSFFNSIISLSIINIK